MRVLVVGMSPLPFRFYQALQVHHEVRVCRLNQNLSGTINQASCDSLLIWAENLSLLMLKKVLTYLKERSPHLKILVAGCRYPSPERAVVLNHGAHGCLSGRICPAELVARVEVMNGKNMNQDLDFMAGDFRFDFEQNLAFYQQQRIPLTNKETIILAALLRHPGFIISPRKLYKLAWPNHALPNSNSLETHLSSLRRKIEKRCGIKIFQTIKGRGYLVKQTI